jgi:hypothetical protein
MLTRCSITATVLVAGLALQAAAQRPAYPIVQEIHVDQSCRLIVALAQPVTPDKPDKDSGSNSPKRTRLKKDPVICHLENVNSSEHREEAIVGNELRRNRVEIEEQEFVLQNIASDPVIFVVEQPVAKGWEVDSDPQPTEMVGTTALFRVHAAPGEIVHLHVGERHTTPLRTKVIRAATPVGAARG